MEVHIFDFDGTIFHSPAPRLGEVTNSHGHGVANRLNSPFSGGGLGWFQSLSTLTPPTVPERPDVESWYVAPVLATIRRLRPFNVKRTGGSTTDAERRVVCYLLTGRDEKYRARIEALLAHADVLADMAHIFLKPHETAGTVRYKLDTIFQLIREHQPAKVFYYDDRPSQGGKLFEGVRLLQCALYPSSSTSSPAQNLSTLASLPVCGAAGDGVDTTLPFSSLFEGKPREQASAERVAQQWVANTVARFNEQAGHGRSSAEYPQQHQQPHNAGYGGRVDLVIDPVRFPPPPRFHFTLYIIPEALASQSERMLSATEQAATVDNLLREKAAYDSGNDTFARFRGPPAGQGHNYRGRSRGGYGHPYSGRGRGRAAPHLGQSGSAVRTGALGGIGKATTSASDYPPLPPT